MKYESRNQEINEEEDGIETKKVEKRREEEEVKEVENLKKN